MLEVSSIFSAQTNLLWAAVISAIVSAAISYYFRKREIRNRLEVEYEYEQRKKLRELIGRYHGRLLNASDSLNRRLWNFYAKHEQGWLVVNGDYSPDYYYFHSFTHRFLNVFSLIRLFEREALYVDARIAEKKDFVFLKYIGALRWCITDVALFDGLTYGDFHQTDHFFADNFRHYCDSCIESDGNFIEFDAFVNRVQEDRSLDEVLAFFDSLCFTEERYRCDRLIALHLLLMAFINAFGYAEQQNSEEQFAQVAKKIRNEQIRQNLAASLSRHGLGSDKDAERIRLACCQSN